MAIKSKSFELALSIMYFLFLRKYLRQINLPKRIIVDHVEFFLGAIAGDKGRALKVWRSKLGDKGAILFAPNKNAFALGIGRDNAVAV